MKRPLFIAALIVLSGMICGIRESGIVMKAAAAVFAAVLLVALKSGVSGKDASLLLFLKQNTESNGESRKGSESREDVRSSIYRRFLMLAAAMLFMAGFARGALLSHKYNTGECSSFFEYYEPGNPGQFNYALYLKSLGICSREQYDIYMDKSTDKDGDNESNDNAYDAPLTTVLNELSSYCKGIFDELLTEHDAGIYKAVLLGDKQGMDEDIRNLYQDAGIAHLLAVSGLHVSMIGAGLFGVFRRRLKAGASAAAVTVILFMYMLMTGAGGSVIRACIMLVMGIYAVVSGRNYCMTSAMSAAALILMMYRPYMIFTSAFQLSFGAVAAIGIAGNSVIRRIMLMREPESGRRRKLPAFISAFIISAAVQLITLPVTAWHYYVFPVYGILLNFIVIPLMTAVLTSGFAVITAGSIYRIAAGCFRKPAILLLNAAAAPGHYILKFYELLSRLSLRLPFARAVIGRPSITQILLYYILLILIVLLTLRVRKSRRKMSTPQLILRCLTAVLLIAAASNVLKPCDSRENIIRMLDVGQGDCIIISSGGTHLLIDGGSSSRKDIGLKLIEPYLLSKGINRLNAVIVSHADADHVNGLEYILSGESDIKTDRLILPKAAEADGDYDRLKDIYAGAVRMNEEVAPTGRKTGGLEKTGMNYDSEAAALLYPDKGEVIMSDGESRLLCLYPGQAGSDKNRQSQVLLYERGNFTMLFTGDTTAEDEEIFSNEEYLSEIGIEDFSGGNRLTVLKAAHHGSRSADSAALFEGFRPQLVMISCGTGNRYGHPHEEVLERSKETKARVLRTDRQGSLAVSIKKDRVYIECFKQSK